MRIDIRKLSRCRTEKMEKGLRDRARARACVRLRDRVFQCFDSALAILVECTGAIVCVCELSLSDCHWVLNPLHVQFLNVGAFGASSVGRVCPLMSLLQGGGTVMRAVCENRRIAVEIARRARRPKEGARSWVRQSWLFLVCLQTFIYALRSYMQHLHQWSSGRIHRRHRCDPGSIPG